MGLQEEECACYPRIPVTHSGFSDSCAVEETRRWAGVLVPSHPRGKGAMLRLHVQTAAPVSKLALPLLFLNVLAVRGDLQL